MTKINYDHVSKIYDKVRMGDQLVVSNIVKMIEVHTELCILDIGCGTGNNSILINDVTEGKVYGIDQSKGMLEKAKEKSSRINWTIGNAVTLENFQEKMFDVAFMVDVIHHIDDIDTMFKNIYKVLKKGGRIFVFTDSHDHIENNRLVSKYFPETIEKELQRYQSTDEITSSLRKNKFSNVRYDDICYPEQEDAGEKLVELAKNKGYSMFHLISGEAIDKGIEKLSNDLLRKKIIYKPKTQMIIGEK